MNTRFLTAIGTYFSTLAAMFAKTGGTKDDALYMDNNDGRFSFVAEPLVPRLNIAQTDADIDEAKPIIESWGTPSVLIDTRTLTLHTWDTTAWTTSVANFGTIIKPSRLYYCPYNSKVYMSDAYCTVRRLRKQT